MVDARSDIVEDTRAPKSRAISRQRSGIRLAVSRTPVELALADLHTEALVRLRPIDTAHVAALAEVRHLWPPIVVAARTMNVLDGVHRVAAAHRLGLTTLPGELFEGDDNEAFVAAVRSNTEHGLPLSLAERSRAARKVLGFSPERSDRAIGEICGLDHKTVSRLREEANRPSGANPQSDVRVGRDQRTRPVDVAMLRSRIAAAITEAPGESLRQIARRVGASPETVRDVRARLARGENPVPAGARPLAGPLPLPISKPVALPRWSTDSACRAAPGTAEFAAWFDAGGRSVEWARYVGVVPLSRAYSIADQARRYAEAWRSFAEALEARTRSAEPGTPD
jgi:ParB-like chromosome segregation protein Spo0J